MNRRDLLKTASIAAAVTPAFAGSQRLPDVTMNAGDAKVSHETFGELRTYFDGPTPQLKHMTAGSLRLKPGMEPHPPHQHPEEEFMVVTEGNGEIVVDGKTTQVGPGSMMFCEGNKLHGIKNTGKAPMTFYFYKWQA